MAQRGVDCRRCGPPIEHSVQTPAARRGEINRVRREQQLASLAARLKAKKLARLDEPMNGGRRESRDAAELPESQQLRRTLRCVCGHERSSSKTEFEFGFCETQFAGLLLLPLMDQRGRYFRRWAANLDGVVEVSASIDGSATHSFVRNASSSEPVGRW